jgi:hypothetical protein
MAGWLLWHCCYGTRQAVDFRSGSDICHRTTPMNALHGCTQMAALVDKQIFSSLLLLLAFLVHKIAFSRLARATDLSLPVPTSEECLRACRSPRHGPCCLHLSKTIKRKNGKTRLTRRVFSMD